MWRRFPGRVDDGCGDDSRYSLRNCGNDGTWGIAEQAAEAHPQQITLIAQRAGEGKQGALRDCLTRARGNILYLTDADCVVPPDTLQRLAKVIAEGEADAATGGHE